MPESTMRSEMIVSEPFQQNAFIVWRPERADALVIDPGFDPRSILDALGRNGLRPAAILNTHGHSDHIAGNSSIKAAFPEAPLLIGRNEAALLSDPELNLSAPFGLRLVSPPADRLVDDGERLDLAGFSIEVREIPGHSPGSVIFLFDEFDPPVVFGGDVLFAGSVGRTDLGGSLTQLASGIRSRLYTLPDATIVHPGHGPSTTVGVERRTNPFVAGLA